ncbi:MAG: hypothetical protein LBE09_03800, partial [Christensenellaceae bacterium]|nr:hypothetical protein [Christensenellaceae bacterium]
MNIKTLKTSLFLTLIVIVSAMFIISLFALSLNAHSNIALSREESTAVTDLETGTSASGLFNYDAYFSNGIRMEAVHTKEYELNLLTSANNDYTFPTYTGPAFTGTDVSALSTENVRTRAYNAQEHQDGDFKVYRSSLSNEGTTMYNPSGEPIYYIAAGSSSVNYYAVYNFKLIFDANMKSAIANGRVDIQVHASITTKGYARELYKGANDVNFSLDNYKTTLPVAVALQTPAESAIDQAESYSYKSYTDKTSTSVTFIEETSTFPKDPNKWWTATGDSATYKLRVHAGTNVTAYNHDGAFPLTTAPTFTVKVRYRTPTVKFVINGSGAFDSEVMSNVNQGGTEVSYGVDIEGKIDSGYGSKTVFGRVTPNIGNFFVRWACDKDSNATTTSPTIEPVKPYNYPYGQGLNETITYTAYFTPIVYGANSSPPTSFTYNGSPQGPAAYINNLSDGATYNHSYYNSSGSGIGATAPTNVGSYKYSVQITRQEKDINSNNDGISGTATTVVVGQTSTTNLVNFTIGKYQPTGNSTSLGVSINTLTFGGKIADSLIVATNKPKLENSPNAEKPEIIGSYSFIEPSNGFFGKYPTSNVNDLQIIFRPSDTTNIETLTLSGFTVRLDLATALVGYKNSSESAFSTDFANLVLNTLIYGQGQSELGMKDKILIKHPNYANNADLANIAIPYTIEIQGASLDRPGVTDEGEFTIKISISPNDTFEISGSTVKYSSVFSISTTTYNLKYKVIKDKLQFPINTNGYSLQFTAKSSEGTNVTSIGTASITYGQALPDITVAVIPNLPNIVGEGSQKTLDAGTIAYTWGRMEQNDVFVPLTEYISADTLKYLTVAEGTNINNTGNENYFCIKAVLRDGQGENANYEPYYFKNQVLIIRAAKINNARIFSANPIIYGQSVKDDALPTNIQEGKAINQINSDLTVYYKIEWNTDVASSIDRISTYPYHEVTSTSGKNYPVKIVIYKNLNGDRDEENYETNGVFTTGHAGTNLQFSLIVNRATQDFYVMVDGTLQLISSANLTAALTAINSNVNEETSTNILGGEDIDVETVYNSAEKTFKIEMYTSAIVFNSDTKYSPLGNTSTSLTFSIHPNFGGTVMLTTGNRSSELYSSADGTYYTKFTYIVNISVAATNTASILNLKIGQYDSGTVIENPQGGNYISKEWTRDSDNATDTPYTIFIKLRRAPAGISDPKFSNPEDSTDLQKYSYTTQYGGEQVIITPNSEKWGTLSIDEEYSSVVEIKDVSDQLVQKFELVTKMPGAVKLIYQAEGYVNPDAVLVDPYIAIYHEFWVYISKKSVDLTVKIEKTSIVYGESPSISVATPANGVFIGDDFNAIQNKIKFIIYNTMQPFDPDQIYPVGTYSVGILNWNTIAEDTTNNARFYTVTVKSDDFTVTKKEVTVYFAQNSTFEIDYCSTPVTELTYAVTYDGILDNDKDAIDTTSNRVLILDPTTEEEIVTNYPPVGTYQFSLLVNNAPANYTYKLETGKSLKIKPVKVNITHADSTTVDYTANIFNFSDKVTVSRVQYGTAPAGPVTIEYVLTNGTDSIEGLEKTTSIRNAGTYSTVVTYTPTESDNYIKTEMIFMNCITVEKVDPTITIPKLVQKYSGVNISYSPSIVGLGIDTMLAGTRKVEFAPQNTDDYSEAMPKNVGIYNVKVTYIPAENDNYKGLTKSATSIIEITKADIVLTTESIPMEVTYNAKYVAKPEIIATGVGDDTSPFNAGFIIVSYSLTTSSDTWHEWNVGGDVKYAPINAGSYDLKIEYLADKGSMFNGTLKNY